MTCITFSLKIHGDLKIKQLPRVLSLFLSLSLMLELYFLETSAAVTNKEKNGQADSKAAALSWLCCNNILCENGKAVPIPKSFCHSYRGKGM